MTGSSHLRICDECVELCNAVLEEHQKAKEATVEARLRASVLEERKKAKEASATVVRRLSVLSQRHMFA